MVKPMRDCPKCGQRSLSWADYGSQWVCLMRDCDYYGLGTVEPGDEGSDDGGWFAVEDGLPRRDLDVLVYRESYPITMAEMTGSHGWSGLNSFEPTHWRFLPGPPAEPTPKARKRKGAGDA
jgi:hypothetical protein